MKEARYVLLLLLLLLSLSITLTAHAAVPDRITYQGKIEGPDGLVSDTLDIFFRLFDAETGDTPLWEEEQPVTVVNGIYNVTLGDGTINTDYGTLRDALLSSADLWLEVLVVGEPSPMTPRQKLTSVPYAFNAEDSSTLDGMTKDDLFNEIKKLTDKIDVLEKRQSGRYAGSIGELPVIELGKRFAEDDIIVVIANTVGIVDEGDVTVTTSARLQWNGENHELTFRFSSHDGGTLSITTRIALNWLAVVGQEY